MQDAACCVSHVSLSLSLSLFLRVFLVRCELEGNLDGFLGDEMGGRGGMTGETGTRPAQPAGNMYLTLPVLPSTMRPSFSPLFSNGLANSPSSHLYFRRRTGTWCSADVVSWNVTRGISGNRMVDEFESCLW